MTRIPLHWALVIHAVLICVLAGAGIFAKRGWLDWRRVERQNQHLEKQIVLAKAEKEALVRQIGELESSKRAQERAVREVLGYVRKGEKVVSLE